jgi:hypothetical protein
MIRYQADSTSEILRATHIVLVRLAQVTFGPQQPGGDFLVEQGVRAGLRIERVLKGTLAAQPGQVVTLAFSVFKNEGARFTALPGIWSRHALAKDAQFVLFSTVASSDPVAVLSEPRSFLCETADRALPDLDRASQDPAPELSLAKLVTRSAENRAAFGSLYARYVAWRLRETVTPETRSDFDSILQVAEDPATSDIFRRIVLTEAYDLLMLLDPAPNAFLARLIWGSVRVLATERGEALREVVIGTLLPNLLGLEGGLSRKQAAEVFAKAGDWRLEVQEVLRTRAELQGREQILEWLSK